MNILSELQPVFRQVFDDETILLTPETTSDCIEGWDSLSHATLIAAVEHHFRVRLETAELLLMRNVGDLVAAVGRHLAP